ncbi:MAG TPA: hypothetical protein VK855_10590 [Thioalkalivibrio sp.]|nr:hypothetical protein [Thioalkalivibrio sp.]
MNLPGWALSCVLQGHAGTSPEMALRIERWLGVERGGRAEVWAGPQLFLGRLSDQAHRLRP